MLNKWVNKLHESDDALYNNLTAEMIQCYGIDIWYIPREEISKNKVLREPTASYYKKAFQIECYILDGDTMGQNTMVNGFGFMFDRSTKIEINKTRWQQEVKRNKLSYKQFPKPRKGDLVYIGEGYNTDINEFYEIMSCSDNDSSMYMGKKFLFHVNLQLFEYNHEPVDTGVRNVDILSTITVQSQLDKAVNDDYEHKQKVVVNQEFDANNPFHELN